MKSYLPALFSLTSLALVALTISRAEANHNGQANRNVEFQSSHENSQRLLSRNQLSWRQRYLSRQLETLRSRNERKNRRWNRRMRRKNQRLDNLERSFIRRTGDWSESLSSFDEEPSVQGVKSKQLNEGKKKPNIILIMTDDQDVELGSLQYMPKLNRYLKEEGTLFENGFVTTPMCCPSRSSILTGLYSHNHHVLTNNDNCSSTEWIRIHEPRTFATYLQTAGYKTGYFGKYLNKYNGNRIPKGWDEWAGLVKNSRFYNYTVNVNGEKIRHGFDYDRDYFPDVITNKSLAFLKESKRIKSDQPVLMVLSYPGPHGPEDSAPQYKDLFFNVTTHHTPAYDYAPNPDKQWILQVTDRMEPIHKKFTDVLMTKRLQTLQSVDDAIEQVYKELEALGELDNTYIFYTSDHGYHLGQFGLVKGKSFPFDVDIKVPYFVRGPGLFNAGRVETRPVLNIDLAPTFLDIAGLDKPAHMDGDSMLSILKPESPWRDSFLVERGKMTENRYEKIYPSDNATNLTDVESLETLLEDDKDEFHDEESSSGVIKIFEKPKLSKQERLALECLKPKHQAPCSPYQRRKCVRKRNGDWKLKKCRRSESEWNSFTKRSPGRMNQRKCHCKPGENFGWRYRRHDAQAENQRLLLRSADGMDRHERILQRDFLRKHTSGLLSAKRAEKIRLRKVRRREQRLLRSLARNLKSKRRNRWRRRRNQRDVHDVLNNTEETFTIDIENPVEDVLDDIAKEEIDEVDIIMEGISEEIEDLEQAMNGSAPSTHRPPDLRCQVTNKTQVNCSSSIYNSRNDWRHSRAFINEQIRRLRSQMQELKEIRRHLRQKRPFMRDRTHHNISLDEDLTSSDAANEQLASIDIDTDIDTEAYNDQIPSDAVRCKCRERNSLERHLRREERQRLRALRRGYREKIVKERRLRKQSRKNKSKMCIASLGSTSSSSSAVASPAATGAYGSKEGKLNCFSHDNDHWRTPPFWTDGSFCACTNSNTNTYWCVRTVNRTHNYLYCEFVSGLITYYNMNVDPYQLRNIYQTLSISELDYMHQQLRRLKGYSGYDALSNGKDLRQQEHDRITRVLEEEAQEMAAESFNNKYGQYLPPPEAYHHRTFGHKRRRFHF